jgi:hypothetical protein
MVVPAAVLEPPVPDELVVILEEPQPETRIAKQAAPPSRALSRPRERNVMGMNRPLSFTPETWGIQERLNNRNGRTLAS